MASYESLTSPTSERTESMTNTQTTSNYTRVAYPGELGYPPVGVSFDIPAGWTTGAVDGALAVAREAQVGPNGFWANVVLSIDRVSASTSLDRVSTSLLDSTREDAVEFSIADERIVEVSGLPGVLREQTLRVEESPLHLSQFVLVLLVDIGDGRARDCVQLTGSIELGRRDQLAALFAQLTDSLTLAA